MRMPMPVIQAWLIMLLVEHVAAELLAAVGARYPFAPQLNLHVTAKVLTQTRLSG